MGSICSLGEDTTDEVKLDEKDKDKDKQAPIQDLNQIVKRRAWYDFDSFRKQKQNKFCCSWKKWGEHFSMEIDWSGVKFIPREPIFEDCDPNALGKPMSHIIFKSVFQNKSPSVQEHKLQTERQTSSTCKSSISQGYTTGYKVGLSIAAPGDIINAAVGFSKGFTIENVQENNDIRTLTWHADSVLKVKERSTIEANIKINEYRRPYKFNIAVAGTGTVKTSILNRNKKCVYEVIDDMGTLIGEVFPEHMWEEDDNFVYMKVAGKCDFHYGIEQNISILSKDIEG